MSFSRSIIKLNIFRVLCGFSGSLYKRKGQDAYQSVWHKEAQADRNEWSYLVFHQQRRLSGVWTVGVLFGSETYPLKIMLD